MKNLVKLLMIISVFAFAGIHSADAQIDVHVGWIIQCPDTCTSHESCSYLVEYTIIDQCAQPQIVVCSDSTVVNCSSFGADFLCDYNCEDATHNPCYLAIGRATKYCNGPLGNIAKCAGTKMFALTCQQLMQGVNIPIEW